MLQWYQSWLPYAWQNCQALACHFSVYGLGSMLRKAGVAKTRHKPPLMALCNPSITVGPRDLLTTAKSAAHDAKWETSTPPVSSWYCWHRCSHIGQSWLLANPGCRRPQPVWPLTSRASCVAQQVPHRFGTAANATPSLVPQGLGLRTKNSFILTHAREVASLKGGIENNPSI